MHPSDEVHVALFTHSGRCCPASWRCPTEAIWIKGNRSYVNSWNIQRNCGWISTGMMSESILFSHFDGGICQIARCDFQSAIHVCLWSETFPAWLQYKRATVRLELGAPGKLVGSHPVSGTRAKLQDVTRFSHMFHKKTRYCNKNLSACASFTL